MTLSGNRFVDNRWGAAAIANVIGPIVRDNLFVGNGCDVTAIGIPSDDEWYDRAKHLLHFEWCRGGTVTGNVDAGNPGIRRHMQRDCVDLDLSAPWKETYVAPTTGSLRRSPTHHTSLSSLSPVAEEQVSISHQVSVAVYEESLDPQLDFRPRSKRLLLLIRR